MKPPRTIGLSLAIVASVILFSILPLLQIAAPYLIQYRVSQVNLPLPDESGDVSPMLTGGSYSGVASGEIVFQAAISLGFLVIGVFAWRGRPRWIRGMMISGVLLLVALTVISTLVWANAPANVSSGGIDSSRELSQSLGWARVIFSILIALYVVWYMNRGPARAFYRGYYLERPEQILNQT